MNAEFAFDLMRSLPLTLKNSGYRETIPPSMFPNAPLAPTRRNHPKLRVNIEPR